MTRPELIVATLAVGLALGCSPDPKASRGFRLPDGDPARGKQVFVDLQCFNCHRVSGVELPAPETAPTASVLLGGEARRVRTYGELVTSVIHPSHRIARGHEKGKVSEGGKSRMTNFNDEMRVSQLIDLVAFLQSTYKFVPPETDMYNAPFLK